MDILTLCVLISSLSFLGYTASYFFSPHMKAEFKRFGLEKIGPITILLEFLGAVGLLVGLKFHIILILASLGLALLMLVGVFVRIKLKDSLRISLPAIFFMLLNGFIFFLAVK